MINQGRKGRGPPSPLKLVQVEPGVNLRRRPKFTAPERPGKHLDICFCDMIDHV